MSQQEPQEQQEPGGESLKDLRSAADEGRRAKRELAFVKAGIDTDTPLGAMFATAYDGDLTKDAIAEQWQKIAPPANEPTQELTPEQQQAALEEQQRMEEQATREGAQDRARRGIASAPAEAPPTETVDPLKTGYDQFHQNLADGIDRERAGKPVLEAIIGSAVAGDKRFVWDGKWTDEEMAEGRVRRA